MVGFIREPAKEEGSGTAQPKIKTTTNDDSDSYKFDFDSFSTDFDEFSFASVQPFLDFDVIDDWIEEMQDPDRDKAEKVSMGSSGIGVESCMQNPIVECSVDFVQDMKDSEESGPLTVDDNAVNNRIEMCEDASLVKPCGVKDCSMVDLVKSESDNVELAEICYDDHNQSGEVKISHEEKSIGFSDEDIIRLESLSRSIEEGLEKVNLVGSPDDLIVTATDVNETKVTSIDDGDDSDSDSESESGSEASPSSSSSSEIDDDVEEKKQEELEEKKKVKSCEIKSENTKQEVEIEEGEIMGSDLEKSGSSSDNDDVDDCEENDITDGADKEFEVGEGDDDDDEGNDHLPKGPIKSRNEVVVLPPVPPVNVTLQPFHQISHVGIVTSILGTQVIVEGAEKHSPLNEGSILWIAETRLPLGVVDEIFGPVKTPYYAVRYNSESEVPSGILNGTVVGFVAEFADHVLNDKNIYQKGYDASGENDEEVFDEAEFSDDEKEAEYRRMLKISKRGNTNQGSENQKKNRRNIKIRERTWTKDQPTASLSLSPAVQPPQPTHHVRAPVPSLSQVNPSGQVNLSSQVSSSGPSPSRPTFPTGSSFPQPAQPAGLTANAYWQNAMPFQQQQNMAFPSGFQMNGMTWLQQPLQPQQMPSMIPTYLQQQQFFPQIPQTISAPYHAQPFDNNQLISGSFGEGPTSYLPWPIMMGPNPSNQAPPQFLPGASAQLPTYQGFVDHGQQNMGQSGSQPATAFLASTGARPQFNQGFSSGGGRGRMPFQQRGRGGRFGGRRGH